MHYEILKVSDSFYKYKYINKLITINLVSVLSCADDARILPGFKDNEDIQTLQNDFLKLYK